MKNNQASSAVDETRLQRAAVPGGDPRTLGAALKVTLRIVIPIALIALLLSELDWSRAGEQLAQVSIWAIVVLFGVMVAELVVSTVKWSYALRMHGLRYPFTFLFRALCSGFFLNSFLPTAVGGDVYRVYKTLPRDGFRSRALSAVLIERAVGLLSLLALGAIGALLLADRFQAARLYFLSMLAASVAGAAVILVLHAGWLHGVTAAWERFPALAAVRHSVGLMRNRGRDWAALLATSVLYQSMSIGILFFLFALVAAEATLAASALIAAMVGVAAVLPISINGIGVMEGALVAGAVMLGIDYDKAVVVAFLRRSLNLSLAAACGLFHAGMAVQIGRIKEGPLGRLVAALPWRSRRRVRPSSVPLAVESSAGELAAAAVPDVPLVVALPRADAIGAELLEFTHDAIIIWEMGGGGIRYFNRAAEQLYGYSREAAQGRVTHELLRTEVTGGVGVLEKKLARYGIWVGELQHTTSDGRRLDVEGRLALMSQRSGRWLVLEVNRDISDRKAAEAARRDMARHLAALRKSSDCG